MARNPAGGLRRVLALQWTALILWFIANMLPFLSLVVQGHEQVTTLMGASLTLYQEGMGWLAFVVALTTVVGPALLILSSLYLLLGIRSKRMLPGARKLLAWISHLRPWAMLDVFLLGVIVSFVKLVDLADVVIGPSFYAFIALMLVSAAAMSAFEPRLLWNRLKIAEGVAHD